MTEPIGEAVASSVEDLIATHAEFLAAIDCGASAQVAIRAAYGWDLEIVDSQMALSQIDQIVIRRLNDFVPSRSRPLILDCGANIGISVLHYKSRFPGARIIAFEPDAAICRVLRQNLARNGAGDVEVAEAAIWTSTGRQSFFSTGMDGGRIDANGYYRGQSDPVATVDLRNYLVEPIDLLKLDIESAEYEVVHHVRKRLADVANLIVECHIDQQSLAAFSRLIGDLQAYGFELSLNTFGHWRDLIRRSAVTPPYSEQYIALYGWRRDAAYPKAESSYLPYVDLSLLVELSRAHNRRSGPEFFERSTTAEQRASWMAEAIAVGGPFVHDGGYGWRIRLPDYLPGGDDERRPRGSPLALLENGAPVGPPHSQHVHIRNYGGGRFSHWHDTLYFSTPDDSNPNVNGRSYAVAIDSRSNAREE